MARLSQKVFIETSFFLAFIDRTNINHAKASAIFEYLAKNQFQVYTSFITILQTCGKLERDLGSVINLEFLQTSLESKIQILYMSKTEHLAAFRYLRNNYQRQISLTEIINANLMDKHDVSSVLTFDHWHNLMGTKVSSLIN